MNIVDTNFCALFVTAELAYSTMGVAIASIPAGTHT